MIKMSESNRRNYNYNYSTTELILNRMTYINFDTEASIHTRPIIKLLQFNYSHHHVSIVGPQGYEPRALPPAPW